MQYLRVYLAASVSAAAYLAERWMGS